MMMMWSRVENCRSCGKSFLVTAGGAGPFDEHARISCPHCGTNWGSAKTLGVIVTHRLTAIDEVLWLADAPQPFTKPPVTDARN